MRSAPWTTVTREPNRAKIWANSSPTGPAPTTSSDSGTSVSSSAVTWSSQSTPLDPADRRHRRPRAGGDQDPVRSELGVADTARVRASRKLASPRKVA